ncbi:MAG TPA: SUMF1/EgtB/PvdO family nonheme iron enzyme [Saprospiraceae bacterium]|nr:SUMF1/EgtB/PvdO family nonheme iron enzyme [Saprospiraceae bacterium]
MSETAQNPLNTFIIYAREDKDALLELKKQLIPLERSRQIALWYDGEIVPGEEWEKAIKTRLETADIILLLLSSDFFASDYIEKEELRAALARHERAEAVVAPVIVRHCLWQAHPEIEKLQVLPDNAFPVYSKKNWDSPDEAFANVAAGIARMVKSKAEAAIEKQRQIEAEKQRKEEEARKKREAEEDAAREKHEEEEFARIFMSDMVQVKGGTFTMGWVEGRDEGLGIFQIPAHEVTLKDFYIGKYPVTQAQWRAVMGSDPPELNNKGCDNCPVECVSWNDIQEFLKRLNALTGQQFRLPTEAEWEYAARGGHQSKGYLYSGSNNLDEVGWYSENSGGKTHPVGQKKPNELGLYDMSGNVWEWCEDDWHENYNDAPTDGRAWVDSLRDTSRANRGGSSGDASRHCRVADRSYWASELRSYDLSFRLAHSAE